MTQAGIEPATFLFVAQHLNHCASAVPPYIYIYIDNLCRIYKTLSLASHSTQIPQLITRLFSDRFINYVLKTAN